MDEWMTCVCPVHVELNKKQIASNIMQDLDVEAPHPYQSSGSIPSSYACLRDCATLVDGCYAHVFDCFKELDNCLLHLNVCSIQLRYMGACHKLKMGDSLSSEACSNPSFRIAISTILKQLVASYERLSECASRARVGIITLELYCSLKGEDLLAHLELGDDECAHDEDITKSTIDNILNGAQLKAQLESCSSEISIIQEFIAHLKLNILALEQNVENSLEIKP